MKEEEKIALFDAYLAGELDVQKASDFESSLVENSDLKEEFEAYKAISQEIFEGQEYAEITSRISTIHDEIYQEKSKSKPLILRPKFMITIGIAATITLLIMIVGPLNNLGDGAETANEDVSAYQELDNGDSEEAADEGGEGSSMEEYEMLPEENDSVDDVDSSVTIPKLEEELPVVDKLPRGSCFLISKNGYFITSKHLVRKRRYVKLQQEDQDIAFFAEVIYRDSIMDFAILKCSEKYADNFKSVPFKFYRSEPRLGDDVFTLGYPKSDIVYTTGVISSERGFRKDSMSFQISMPSNPGNSGAPLFTQKGDLVGMVIANNSKKQSVTYILKPDYIQERLSNLQEEHDIDMSSNYTKRFNKKSDLIARYRNFIFEIH